MALPTTLRALRHRDFRLFVSGQVISLVGSWMQTVAQSWLVYRLTGSPLLLGAVGFTGQIPVFLLAPLGGIVADRGDRRRIVVVTQVASMVLAGVLTALTLGGGIRVWHVMVLSALLGAVNAFDIPARQSFLVDMVGKDDLMNAIALNSSIFNGARVVGPGVAGLMVAVLGKGWCFLLSTWLRRGHRRLLMMKVVTTGGRATDRPSPRSSRAFASHGRRGRSAHPAARGAHQRGRMPYTVLMPIFADQILHGGARGLGF